MSRGVMFPILAILVMLVGSFTSGTARAGGMPAEEESADTTPLEKAIQQIEAEQALKRALQKPGQEPAPEPEPVEQQAEAPLEEILEEQEETAQPSVTMDMNAVAKESEADNMAPAPPWRFVELVPNSSFLGLSIGFYDAFDDQVAGEFGFEYQAGWRIARYVQPVIGGFTTSDGSLYGYAGLGVPIPVGDHFMLRPTFAGGAYKEGGGVDLGQALIWRGGLEASYVFDNKSRLGIEAAVLTNAKSMDDQDRTETISLKYTMPMEKIEGFDFRD